MVSYETGATECLGNIMDEHLIANKAAIVRRAVERDSHSRVPWAWGTQGDISFLELVDH